MSSHERAAARAVGPDLQPRAQKDGAADDPNAEWADLVAGIEEELVEVVDETTERALAHGLIDRDAGGDGVPEPAEEDDGFGDDGPSGQVRARARRATVVSPIPALLAQSMGRVPDIVASPSSSPFSPSARADVAAPRSAHTEITRPVIETAAPAAPVRSTGSDGYQVEVIEAPASPKRARVALLIQRAKACLEQGDLSGAVLAADEVLAGSESHTSPISDLIESARPLIDRIFSAYLGLLGEVPVMARSAQEIAQLPFDEKTRTFLSRVDGVLTLEQLFNVSKIPPVEAVRIAASLMCAGVIRVV
jgi:hypothetical protein